MHEKLQSDCICHIHRAAGGAVMTAANLTSTGCSQYKYHPLHWLTSSRSVWFSDASDCGWRSDYQSWRHHECEHQHPQKHSNCFSGKIRNQEERRAWVCRLSANQEAGKRSKILRDWIEEEHERTEERLEMQFEYDQRTEMWRLSF